MKIWLDDVREPPNNTYLHCKNIEEAKNAINFYEKNYSDKAIVLDLDHDLGENNLDGIKLLDWLEENKIVDNTYFFRIHSMNPVGKENMFRIITKNNWRVI